MTNRMRTIDGFASTRIMLAALREEQVSATELLELHIERIARYNPRLNAIVIPNEERARQCAAEADAAQSRGESLGLLHGLLLTIKEWISPQL
jgi:amidase